jgi:hypothetical protein
VLRWPPGYSLGQYGEGIPLLIQFVLIAVAPSSAEPKRGDAKSDLNTVVQGNNDVRHSSARSAIPPICSGHIDRMAQVDLCNLLRSATRMALALGPTAEFELSITVFSRNSATRTQPYALS